LVPVDDDPVLDVAVVSFGVRLANGTPNEPSVQVSQGQHAEQ
jgi:hypothetical protein